MESLVYPISAALTSEKVPRQCINKETAAFIAKISPWYVICFKGCATHPM